MRKCVLVLVQKYAVMSPFLRSGLDGNRVRGKDDSR